MSKHLRIHPQTKAWVDAHAKHTKRFSECIINKPLFHFLLVFIGSSLPVNILREEKFVSFVNLTINCPSPEYLRNTLLESVLSKLLNRIQKKLRQAISISLMIDLWSNRVMTGYIGLGAVCTFSDGHRELMILDLQAVTEKHTAENVKIEIENMVNSFDFDKSKLNGNKKIK